MAERILRIREWATRFENNRSREIKRLEYVLIPNTMDTDGYTALMDHPNAAAHLGAWIAMLQIASRAKDRGTLATTEGRPHTPKSLARISRIPAEVFDELIPRLLSEELQWMEAVSEIPQEGAGIPQEGATPTRAPGRVKYCSSTVEVSEENQEVKKLSIVPPAGPSLAEIVATVAEMYAAGGVPVPEEHQRMAVQMLMGVPPDRPPRLARYVAWAFASGKWPAPAKTKTLLNLIRDGDWDVEITQRILPQARDPAGKNAAADAVTMRFRERMAREGRL